MVGGCVGAHDASMNDRSMNDRSMNARSLVSHGHDLLPLSPMNVPAPASLSDNI